MKKSLPVDVVAKHLKCSLESEQKQVDDKIVNDYCLTCKISL